MSPEKKDYLTGEPKNHDCIQEKRLERIEKDQEHLAKQHENTLKELNETNKKIDKKLTQIWQAITTGDNRNTMYIIMMAGTMIASLAAVFIAFMAFFRIP